MKMNKKGMTLTELLVSIIMLIVAITLMYSLLKNIQKKKGEVDSKSGDLIKISDIEKRFQDVVMGPCEYGRSNVSDINVNVNTVSNMAIISYTKTNNYSFEIKIDNDNKISLSNLYDESNKTTWNLKKKCAFKDLISSPSDNIYNIIIKCGEGNTTDYIKFPMFFRTS